MMGTNDINCSNKSTQQTCKFAAAACNRHPGALASLPTHNIAAYAASSNVIILDTCTYKVITALPVHSSSITHISLVATQVFPILVTSASSGSVSVWQPQNSQNLSIWIPLCSWNAHKGPAITLDAILLSQPHDQQQLFIASAGTDGLISTRNVLLSTGEILNHSHTPIQKASGHREVLPECIAIFPQLNDALIALGGTDRRIQIYVHQKVNSQLTFLKYLDGHRDWIRALAFSKPIFENGDNSPPIHYLASASTDGTARVWRITSAEHTQDQEIPTSRVLIHHGDNTLAISLSALLNEHTSAVHNVSFEYPQQSSSSKSIHIVTASNDCSVAVWRPSELGADCVARFGLMGGQSAHALGFFGAVFTKHDISEVLGHNFGGALHRWKLKKDPKSMEGTFSYEYESQYAPGGHFDKVNSLSWSQNGKYLLTSSSDKTARIFTEVGEDEKKTFVEWARPQVHGHSIFTATFADEEGLKYISGAEEKMLRVFEAPANFEARENKKTDSRQALYAVVPELGLSNKAIMKEQPSENTNSTSDDLKDDEQTSTSDMIVSSFGATRSSSVIPLEDDLKQHTIWPETAKLYGHGNEVSCAEVNIQEGILASACRAQQEKDACIILWDMHTGVETNRLFGHELTVNDMRFSKDGNMLVSISKDRSYAVFKRDNPQERFKFKLIERRKVAHARVIYTCSWLSQGNAFLTGARDKCIKVHRLSQNSDGMEEVLKQKFESGVTAIDCTCTKSFRDVIAAGFEDGHVRIFSIDINEEDSPNLKILHQTEIHSKCSSKITKVRWRPQVTEDQDDSSTLELAISSEDYSVRVFSYHQLNIQ